LVCLLPSAYAQSCGDTITHNTTLYADLGVCVGDALSISGTGITLDLNGHSIAAVLGVGVRVLANSPDATITNGSVSAYTGIESIQGNSDRLLVYRVAIRAQYGINALNVNDLRIIDNSIDVWNQSARGIILRNNLAPGHSKIRGNSITASNGVIPLWIQARGTTIIGNSIDGPADSQLLDGVKFMANQVTGLGRVHGNIQTDFLGNNVTGELDVWAGSIEHNIVSGVLTQTHNYSQLLGNTFLRGTVFNPLDPAPQRGCQRFNSPPTLLPATIPVCP
jgi:hypothetical protein